VRIVSLLPSATEIVCCVGLQPDLVGVTHECDYPTGVADLPVVTTSRIPKGLASREIDTIVRTQLESDTALYSLKMDVLEALKPDLIISQSLCDVCAVAANEVEVAACQLPGQPRVLNLEPASLEDVFDTIIEVGRAAACEDRARQTVATLQGRVDCVRQKAKAVKKRPRVAVLEWLDPLFNAGHWTPQLVDLAGGIDCLGNLFEPSTTISWNRLIEAAPDVIVVALCGFDIVRSRKDVALMENYREWSQLPAVRTGKVHVVDGNAYFSRPGPRLVESLELLRELFG
jgi:iron complex transport system substrate-binding protein